MDHTFSFPELYFLPYSCLCQTRTFFHALFIYYIFFIVFPKLLVVVAIYKYLILFSSWFIGGWNLPASLTLGTPGHFVLIKKM